MPIEYAVPKVHKFLVEEGIRDNITIIASGGIRTAYDMAKIIAMERMGFVLERPISLPLSASDAIIVSPAGDVQEALRRPMRN